MLAVASSDRVLDVDATKALAGEADLNFAFFVHKRAVVFKREAVAAFEEFLYD